VVKHIFAGLECFVIPIAPPDEISDDFWEPFAAKSAVSVSQVCACMVANSDPPVCQVGAGGDSHESLTEHA
jgi:hypothetical protein